MTATPPEKRQSWWRRRLQFSLRTLLIAAAVVGGICGWLAWNVKRADDGERAVGALLKLGARITYDFQLDSQGNRITNAEPPRSTWFQKLLGSGKHDHVVAVMLADKQHLSDEDVRHVAYCRNLKVLSLDNTRISGRALRHVHNLTRLEKLSLNYTKIDDDGMAFVAELTRLEYLGLSRTKVTDAGLWHVRGCTEIDTLVLFDTDVGDQGLSYLTNWKKLQTLNLQGTNLTDAGIRHLRAFPQLSVLLVSRTTVGDEGAAHLGEMPALMEIHLERTRVTAAAFEALRIRMPQLTTWCYDDVDLANQPVTQASWTQIAWRFPALDRVNRLKLINLSGTPATDEWLKDLMLLTNVQLIDLRNTNVTAGGVAELRKALPKCEIRH
jgi:internalin A